MCDRCEVCGISLLSIEDTICIDCYRDVFGSNKDTLKLLPAVTEKAMVLSKVETSLQSIFGKREIQA